MFIIEKRFTRALRVLACGLAAFAIAASSAVARPAEGDAATPSSLEQRTDFRSPDTRDAAEGYAPELTAPAQVAVRRTDFRSPDTRDAAEGYAPELTAPAQVAVERTDFRSPDTRDAAEGYAPTAAAERASEARGFDWGTAGITLAGAAGLLIVALAMFSAVRLGRGRVARP